MTISDEKLSAFIDGELPDSEMAAISAKLHDDTQMAERLAALAEANNKVVSAYAPIVDEPVPERILKMLQPVSDAPTESVGNVVRIDTAKSKPRQRNWLAALAASLTLALGYWMGLGDDANNFDEQWVGTITAAHPLFNVLEQTPSATIVTLPGRGKITAKPILSFKSRSGDYCREYQTQSKVSATRGVACRKETVWEVVMVSKTGVDGGDGYRTASGYSDKHIEQLVDEMMLDVPLGAEEERTLLSQQWK